MALARTAFSGRATSAWGAVTPICGTARRASGRSTPGSGDAALGISALGVPTAPSPCTPGTRLPSTVGTVVAATTAAVRSVTARLLGSAGQGPRLHAAAVAPATIAGAGLGPPHAVLITTTPYGACSAAPCASLVVGPRPAAAARRGSLDQARVRAIGGVSAPLVTRA